MTLHGMLVTAVLGFSSFANAHVLSGCWSGPGTLLLPPFPLASCARIAVKHEFKTGSFTMKALAMDCPNFDRSWDEKSFEVRNGNEIWGGTEGGAAKVLGWLERESYWFDEPVNAMQFIEFKADFNPSTGRIAWLETFAHNQKIYWKLEGDLTPVSCEAFAR